MGKHSLTTELLALREDAQTTYEHQLVTVIGKMYGMLTAQELRLRLLSDDDEKSPGAMPGLRP